MSQLPQDLRFALRQLVRTPGFALLVILTLALGIGANTALFSVVKAVLLEPLPYRDPGSLAMIWSQWTGFPKTWVSVQEYHGYRENLRSFSDLALFGTLEVSITDGDTPERVAAAGTTANIFSVLGVTPVHGRTYTAEEAEGDGASVVVLGHALWQRRYGGDPSAVGRSISVNGEPMTIIGVMPPGFRLPLDFATDGPTEIWAPQPLPLPADLPYGGGSHGSYVVGRLAPGITPDRAEAELDTYIARLNADSAYPPDWNFRALFIPVDAEVAGGVRPALLVLLGAVGLVLLIACANVANLLLVRGEDRRREIAVRAAVGAGRSRIVRQLLTENVLLAAIGGGLGLWIAVLALDAFVAAAPESLPRIREVTVDATVLAFTAAVAIFTALLFGLAPALQAAGTDAGGTLREGGRGSTVGRSRLRARYGLVTAEIALAVVLAIGAGLMLRTFRGLTSIEPGFESANVMTMRLAPPSAFYPDEPAVQGFYDELLRRVRALPGVEHAGLIRVLPIESEIGDSCISVQGYTPPPHTCAPADWQAASDGYFEAMRYQLVAGRFLEPGDRRDSRQVIVVNEAFVRKYIPQGDPIGHQVTFAFGDSVPAQSIVGVVADARHNGITGEVKPTFYRPHAQWAVSTGFPQRTMTLVVRTAGDERAVTNPIRQIIRDLDPRLPVSRVQSMQDVMAEALAQPRFTMQLLLAFGGLALGLALIGIYGVVSYAVAARRHEMGIRLALGAVPSGIVWLALRRGLGQAAIGVGAGLVGAGFAARALAGLVYQVGTLDALTYVSVALVAVFATTAASWWPARRAAHADPLSALRHD